MQRKKRSLKGNKTSGSAQERTSGIYVFFPCGHWLGRPGCHALGARIEANLTSLGPFFLKCKLPRPDCDENTRIPQCMQRSNLYVYETPLLPRWCNLRKKKKSLSRKMTTKVTHCQQWRPDNTLSHGVAPLQLSFVADPARMEIMHKLKGSKVSDRVQFKNSTSYNILCSTKTSQE